jgi:ABC-type Fe3+-hydroxamate transport system substrate-binding protein
MYKLKRRKLLTSILLAVFILSTLALSGCGSDEKAEAAREWTLVNPQGVAKVDVIKLNPHPTTLEGKTVVLRWNGKENGDNLLDGIADQLQKNVKDIKVIKVYETMPETVGYGVNKMGPEVIEKIAALKPDLVIGGQAD